MTIPNGLLSTALQAVNLAARIIRTHAAGEITPKGDRDMATEVDFLVERQVRSFLAERTPSVGFLGEEEGSRGEPGNETAWVLDPLDGTANFVHRLPLCAVSLGLIQSGRARLGVITLPFLDQTYSAADGEGAYSGERRLTVRNNPKLADAIISTGDYAVGVSASEKNRSRFKVTEALASKVQRVRMFGSAAIDLAWVAEGRLDACISLSNKPWDTTAGVVIAREAGARVVDLYGQPHSLEAKATIAASPALLEELLAVLGMDAVE